MKVYQRYERNHFYYPEDMKTILAYLDKRGEILVKPSTIERLYRRFSDEKYSAGWMSVYDEILEEFEEWLNDYEL